MICEIITESSMLLTRLWSSIAGISLEDIIDDDDRQLQKKTQMISTPRVLASVPNRRRVQGGNTDDHDDDNDDNDDKNNNDDNDNDNDDNNDDNNNNSSNNNNNNNNDGNGNYNDDKNDNNDDTDDSTPSPTELDIKEPCTICNDDSLGINTNAILPTNDMTCNDLVDIALKINECNTIQLSEGICCITPVPSGVPSLVPSSSYMPSMAPIPYTRSPRIDV